MRKPPLARMKLEELLKIGALFKALDWPIDDTIATTFPLLFTRFCRMWERLQPRQRELIVAITPSFFWIRDDGYGSRFERVWRRLIETLPKTTQLVEITALPSDGDDGEVKSSHSMHYLARSKLAMMRSFGIKVSIRNPASTCTGGANSALVLFDDYVGTGNTVEKALSILQKHAHDSAWGEIYVLAIAAQRAAAARLKACGFTLIADEIRDRGISDCHNLDNIEHAMHIMDEIGENLGIQKRDRLGYEGTEALIALMRTPNNTFPVFWTNNKVSGKVWDAPFIRYTDSEEQDFESEAVVPQTELPACKVGGRYTEEALRVLECIRSGHAVEALVSWKIPYPRVLHYLHSLFEFEQIEVQGSSLRLTAAGNATLRRPPHKRVGRKREFSNEEPPVGDEKRLYVPDSLVK